MLDLQLTLTSASVSITINLNGRPNCLHLNENLSQIKEYLFYGVMMKICHAGVGDFVLKDNKEVLPSLEEDDSESSNSDSKGTNTNDEEKSNQQVITDASFKHSQKEMEKVKNVSENENKEISGETPSCSQTTENVDTRTEGTQRVTTTKDQWKAAKTIFIIMGYYVISWLCFFMNMLLIASDRAGGKAQ